MNTEQLQQRLAALHQQATDIQARADREGRTLTASEEDEINIAFSEFDDVEDELKRRQRLEKQTARMESPQQRKTPPALQRSNTGSAEFEPHYPGVFGASRPGSFRAALDNQRGDAGGFHGLADFVRSAVAAARGMPDPRLRAMPRMGSSEGTGSDGGFLVPGQLVTEILEMAFQTAKLASLVRTIPMLSNNLTVAGWGTHSHVDNKYGGVRGYWEGETDSATPQGAKAREISFKAKKNFVLVRCSNELLSDAPGASEQLGLVMSEAIGIDIEQAILDGNGVSRPLGILQSPACITVTKESGQTADTIVYENLAGMLSRLHPASHGRAIWIISQTTLKQLLAVFMPISDVSYGGSNGIVGGQPLIQPAANGTFTLLGRPVILSEHSPVLGDAGDIALVDPQQYLLAVRPSLGIETSMHIYFDSDETAFRLINRLDGAPRWAAPITPATGSETCSPFVRLGSRA